MAFTDDALAEINRLALENSDKQQRINKAVRDLDTLITRIGVDDPAHNLARKVQSDLRGK